MATWQSSSNGKPKSPRVQVVLPEDLCGRLTAMAEKESRTVSNMAKVFIQEGISRYEQKNYSNEEKSTLTNTESFRTALEGQKTRRLRGAPRRIKLLKP